MSTRNLEKIFDPKSIAVIGASDREGSVGYIIFNNLIGSGYNGVVFPINPKRNSVQGVKTFNSVSDLPEKVDLAVIATPAETVPDLVEECGKAGIKGIVIISAGFAEMGEEGKKHMSKIDELRTKYDQRIIGPNCLGVIRPKNKMNASFAKNIVSPGKIAFISQSGALGTAVLDWALANNIGFSNFASLGSMLDVDFGDLIDYFGADNETDSIILYVESITQARRFMSASRGFAMNKPIIVIKSGRVAEGARAAASHTGAMAGEDEIYDAAFKRVGIVRVNEIEDLFNCAETLAKQPRPNGNRLAIITNAGGPGVMATDSLISLGGKLAELSPDTIEKLNEVLPPFWSRSNPVDILGDASSERYAKALDICLKDENIDGALVILTPQAMTESTETAKLLVEKSKGHNKPILASWMGCTLVNEGRTILREGNIPEYEYPEQAVKTFMYMYQYKKNIELLYETPGEIVGESQIPVKQIKETLKNINNSGRIILSRMIPVFLWTLTQIR
jgi:acetyltransferase